MFPVDVIADVIYRGKLDAAERCRCIQFFCFRTRAAVSDINFNFYKTSPYDE